MQNRGLVSDTFIEEATDVTPILATARLRAGGAIDPIAAYRASGYRRQAAERRPAASRFGVGIV